MPYFVFISKLKGSGIFPKMQNLNHIFCFIFYPFCVGELCTFFDVAEGNHKANH